MAMANWLVRKKSVALPKQIKISAYEVATNPDYMAQVANQLWAEGFVVVGQVYDPISDCVVLDLEFAGASGGGGGGGVYYMTYATNNTVSGVGFGPYASTIARYNNDPNQGVYQGPPAPILDPPKEAAPQKLPAWNKRILDLANDSET